MKKLILVISLFMLPLSSFAQDAETKSAPDNAKSPLTLTIRADKEVYEAGDNIELELEINNSSSKEMIFFWDKGPVIWHLIPSKTIDGVIESVVETSLMRNETNIETIYIKPNQSIHKTVSVDGSKSSLGIYRLKFYYNFRINRLDKIGPNQELWMKPLTSNIITIKVVQKKVLDKARAQEIAESYIDAQYYKDAYEHRAYEVVERQDYFDVYFHRKNRSTEKLKGQGLVRVDKKTWAASWIPGE